jgi:hypothetical protein
MFEPLRADLNVAADALAAEPVAESLKALNKVTLDSHAPKPYIGSTVKRAEPTMVHQRL